MPKIAFIGGGSAKFVGGLARDLFTFDALREGGDPLRLCLMDINPERMNRSERLIRRMIEDRNLAATVESTTDQRRALDGADYVIVTIMVGGFRHYESDGAIPVKYGVLPTVGDTIGPGAVFRIIRTAPVLAEIARNLRELSPNAWVLNYTNPMAMVTWTLLDEGHDRTVGLCHSIQGAYKQIAQLLDLPADRFRYTAAGINHVDFYLTLQCDGRDVYPMLLAAKDRILAKHPALRVKFDLLEHLGHWPAEGEQHQNEYYPWFNKTEAQARDYGAETMWGFHFDRRINGELDKSVEDQIDGRRPIRNERSHEYGAEIINAIEGHGPCLIYGNVRNGPGGGAGLIENLPPRAVVEVPCHVDGNGIAPCRAGRIPPQLTAVMTPHIHVHEMAVEAARTKDRRLVYRAVQADPLTAAVLMLPRIREMTNELMEENRQYMEDWA